jgi:hypothetical protein
LERICRQPQVRGGQESISYYVKDCQKYALAINAEEMPFLAEPLIMTLLLSQHKMIKWLSGRIK